MLRGAFGSILRRVACTPQCTEARECELRIRCLYARVFEPSAIARGPSGLRNWPRPFVFRARHLDGITVPAGQSFHFDLNLFDTEASTLACLVVTFAQLAREGLGAGRPKADLLSAEQLDDQGHVSALTYDAFSNIVRENVCPLALDLSASESPPVNRILVRFLTPTELKSGQQNATRPEFGILAARIRDRISMLRELYGPGPLEIAFRSFGERANRVQMARCELRNLDITRRSSRTGQVHRIGGFVGEAEYHGDLREFMPYLILAKWTGVGRQTVWGKGEIETVRFE